MIQNCPSCVETANVFGTGWEPTAVIVLGLIALGLALALVLMRFWKFLPGTRPSRPQVTAPRAPRENPRLVFLRKKGVAAWNERRARRGNAPYRPGFANIDFTKEKSKTRSRIWGKPADLVGGERVVLSGIDLRNAVLTGCQLGASEEQASVATGKPAKKGSNAKAAAPPPTEKRPGADLRRALLQNADLSGEKTNLRRVNFERADLARADLSGADARGANFARAKLIDAHLVGTKLQGANFAWADLTGAQFSSENLKNTNLFGAKLVYARVDGLNPRWLLFGRQVLGSRLHLGPPDEDLTTASPAAI